MEEVRQASVKEKLGIKKNRPTQQRVRRSIYILKNREKPLTMVSRSSFDRYKLYTFEDCKVYDLYTFKKFLSRFPVQ